MNAEELRERRQQLCSAMDYCPPDSASETAWDSAINRAVNAQECYDRLAPVFALLDALDAAEARVDRLEKRVTELDARIKAIEVWIETMKQQPSLGIPIRSDGWLKGNGTYPDDTTENHE